MLGFITFVEIKRIKITQRAGEEKGPHLLEGPYVVCQVVYYSL